MSEPIFYLSTRVGKNKKKFIMYKFRTMALNTPEIHSNNLINPEQYITRIGKFLRKFSIDEIPQLYNVLKGDMSLVGPRPALPSQKDLIIMRDKYEVNSIKPGITGLAQVNGRDLLSLESKVYFDNIYKINNSLFFDLKIIIKTLIIIFKNKTVKH